ncbi:MAG: hypothetical protein AVDCRST_MAG88-1287 [uncultured Thermomicrobiales bacterium]|uniref:Uncharacterized protein n=1 Tax=uncultured Thermomicrobiales bacterium TaxID=1645740 RepID=A0A6J4UR09_9BACT|nr:MAG: hypothetical protein AVDCRST_MAG88-1287 [uncultured Thermomicrobiales bacterium]
MSLLPVARVLAILGGLAAVYATAAAAIRTFVLPRGVSDPLAGGVFLGVRSVFDFHMKHAHACRRTPHGSPAAPGARDGHCSHA